MRLKRKEELKYFKNKLNFKENLNYQFKYKEFKNLLKNYQILFNKINDVVYIHSLTSDNLPGKFIEINETEKRTIRINFFISVLLDFCILNLIKRARH